MAALFRDFSFSAASRHPLHLHLDHDHDLQTDPTSPSCTNISPTSVPSSDYNMPPSDIFHSSSSMAELQDSFSKHHISSTQNSPLPSTYYDCFRTPDSTAELTMDLSDDTSYNFDSTTSISHSSSSFSSHLARRLQRQHASRLQCTSAHLSKLSSLLDSMVSREDQCYSSHSTSSTTSTSHSSASSDAGDADNSSAPNQSRGRRSSDSDLLQSANLRYRRSGDLKRDMPCVVKSVRVRKRGADRRKRISR